MKPQLRLVLFFVVPTAIIAGVLLFGDFWPANRMIEKQTEWFDGYYYPKITFMILWLGILLPVVLVRWVINSLTSKAKYGSNKEDGADGSTSITIHRPFQLFSSITPVIVLVDGKKIGTVGSGKRVTVSVHPGQRNLSVELSVFNSHPLSLQLNPGDNVQLETGFVNPEHAYKYPQGALYLRRA